MGRIPSRIIAGINAIFGGEDASTAHGMKKQTSNKVNKNYGN